MQSKTANNHTFYNIQFSARLKKISTSDFFEELISAIKRWLIGKYGSTGVSEKIPNWADICTGGKWGDDTAFGSFGMETISANNSNPSVAPWACRIIEGPVTYTQRKWVTEIGYRPLSEKAVEICYLVTYYDLVKRKTHPVPAPNIPNIAKYLLQSNKNWTCSEPYDGKFLTIEDCYELAEAKTEHQPSVNNETLSQDKRWISLCKVNKLDKTKKIWLYRLADAVDGALVTPKLDNYREKIFDNRHLIFREDGPLDPDYIGFWEWTECKNDSGGWWSSSTYIEETKPIEISILHNQSSVEEIIGALKSGLYIPLYMADSILFAVKQNDTFSGLLCDLDNFNVVKSDQCLRITLKDGVQSLPYYELNESDIFTWSDRRVYKYISLGEPKRWIHVNLPEQPPFEFLKQLFLQKMTWPVFKANGFTKNDKNKFIDFLSSIPDSNILETLSQTYGLSAQEAQNCINGFLYTIEANLQAEDVDANLVVQMLEHHAGLKQVCEKAAEEAWRKEHQEEIQQAKADADNIRSTAEQEVLEEKQHLAELMQEIAEAREHRDSLNADMATAQEKLDQLMADIEQYETLGDDTMEAIRQKISAAQKDMAGFLADMSMFLPQQQTVIASDTETSAWKYVSGREYLCSDEDFIAEDYKDELDAITPNLTNVLGVDTAFSNMLSAFLYAAHINHTPLLIAGPGGGDVAEILSASLYSRGVGQLVLGEAYDGGLAEHIQNHPEQIVAVQNMFGKGWDDHYPQMFAIADKQIIWMHPYVEDLAMEPKGLYNYMLPIISECFVGMFPDSDPWPGKRGEKFKAYVSKKHMPLRIAAFKKLGLSRLLLNRLTKVLSDAKAILNSSADERNMEILFGLLPLCVLTGRTEVLKEVIESENGISAAVKAEARRYIEED